MGEQAKLLVYVNPLCMPSLDEAIRPHGLHGPGDAAFGILRDAVACDDPIEVIRNRYHDISGIAARLPVAPMCDVIMDHVIRPLKEAIHCYVLGMPVVCIAQAGLVGEMVALWRFRMLEPVFDGKPWDERLQRLFLGRRFDELGQARRVDVLKAIDTLDEDTVEAFDRLRLIRNRYLHNMVEPQRDIDADARDSLQHAATLVVRSLDMSFRDGCVILPPKVIRYIDGIEHADSADPITRGVKGVDS